MQNKYAKWVFFVILLPTNSVAMILTAAALTNSVKLQESAL
jgi:hypothetical protein